jgi:hypothetical protein
MILSLLVIQITRVWVYVPYFYKYFTVLKLFKLALYNKFIPLSLLLNINNKSLKCNLFLMIDEVDKTIDYKMSLGCNCIWLLVGLNIVVLLIWGLGSYCFWLINVGFCNCI